MSIGTVAGLIFGLGLFLLSISLETTHFEWFWSLSSLVLVAGGTLASTFISFQGIYVLRALKDCVKIFGHAKMNRKILGGEVKEVIKWGQIVRQGGILALDQHLRSYKPDDHLLSYGVQLVIGNYKPEEIRELLGNTIQSEFERRTIVVNVLKNMASTAPAFGMIGTLVGMIIMLQNMSSDIGAVGPALGLALLTTLYGVLVSRLVFDPAATKVLHREEITRFRNYMMQEAFVMLSEERSPRYIEDRMHSFLEPDLIKSRPSGESGSESESSEAE